MQSQRKKILVVDDDDLHLYTTKELLQDDHIEVITHKNAFGVTNAIKSLKPDLILLDINMPALAGDRLVQLIRGHCEANNIHVVFHSSNDEDSLRESVKTHGVRGYICKGDIAGLRNKVATYLNLDAQRDPQAGNSFRSDAPVTRPDVSSRPDVPLR